MLETAQRERQEMMVDLVARVAALFSRIPLLSGFSVQERATLTAERLAAPLDAELSVADVSMQSWPTAHATQEVGAAIAEALVELLDEHPAARGLLRGHTFARTFH